MYFFYIEVICYDDGCHLAKYARNPVRKDLTSTSVKISETEILIDRFHLRNHQLC